MLVGLRRNGAIYNQREKHKLGGSKREEKKCCPQQDEGTRGKGDST